MLAWYAVSIADLIFCLLRIICVQIRSEQMPMFEQAAISSQCIRPQVSEVIPGADFMADVTTTLFRFSIRRLIYRLFCGGNYG